MDNKLIANPIVMYMLHDPISNSEGQITEYDVPTIKQATEAGMVVVGVHSDGRREIVPPEDVKEPETMCLNGIAVATPAYVDARVDALTEAIESLADGISDIVLTEKQTLVREKVAVLTAKKFSVEG